MTKKSIEIIEIENNNTKHLKNSENEIQISEKLVYSIESEPNSNNNNNDSDNKIDVESLEYIIPDGGYGWVIVLVTFMVNATTIGYGYTWGIFQAHYYKNVFHEQVPASTLFFIGSISTSSIFLLGPISTYLIDRFGHKSLMITGTILFAISNTLASFSVAVSILDFLLLGFYFFAKKIFNLFFRKKIKMIKRFGNYS